MLDLAGHERTVNPGVFENTNAAADFSEADPMQIGGELLDGGLGFVFNGNGDDRHAPALGFFQNQEGKSTVSGNQTDSFGLRHFRLDHGPA
jgi:hypothetical protein